MSVFELHQKRILITGASSGIGQRTAIEIAKVGAEVILVGRNSESLNSVFEKLEGRGHEMRQCDLSDEGQINNLVDSIGNIDGVVHSAGVNKPFPIKFLDAKRLDETFSINFNGPVWLMARLFKKRKVKSGASIVFISSISSNYPYKGGASYTASKAALETYSKVLALEYANKQVRSNCISPAMVKTPLYDKAEAHATKELMDAHIDLYPLGVGQPEDVAYAAIYLLSEASRWVTGTVLTLDGGLTAGA